MRPRVAKLTAIVCLLLASAVARGQAHPTALGPGTGVDVGGGYSLDHIEYGQRYLGGLHAWVDATPHYPVGIEAEGTWLRQNTDLESHASTYLIGPRVALHMHGFEPWAKGMVGIGYFTYPYDYAHGRYFLWEAGGGVDFHIGDRVKIRAIDFHYIDWPQFSYGTMKTYGVSAGISVTVFHTRSWRAR